MEQGRPRITPGLHSLKRTRKDITGAKKWGEARPIMPPGLYSLRTRRDVTERRNGERERARPGLHRFKRMRKDVKLNNKQRYNLTVLGEQGKMS